MLAAVRACSRVLITEAFPKRKDGRVGRAVRDARLDKREARQKLAPQKEPYWRLISEGAHLGYYRGERVGKWVARYRRPGTTGGYRKSTLGEADDVRDADDDAILNFAQAQVKAQAWFAKLKTGEEERRGPYTVNQMLDDYMTGFKGKSVKLTQGRIDANIKPEIGTLLVSELTQRRLTTWHHGRAAAPAKLRTSKFATERNERVAVTDEDIRRRRSSANRDLTILKAALNAAFKDKRIASDSAWRNVAPFREADQAKLRYLQDDETRRLANACDPAFRPLMHAALLTGGRYAELTGLRVRDIDLPSSTVRFAITKSGKSRTAYLEDEGTRLFRTAIAGKAAGDLVFPRPDGHRWGASQQARYMKAACENGKVDPTGFHDLRRTYGARLAVKGVPMAVIAEALGHADERITRKHYAHLAPSYVSETVRAAVRGLGIVEKSTVRRIAG